MLNEDKIRLMNEIASFEKNEGKKELPAKKYFKNDYIAKHMIQSFFAFTLCYLLILVVVVLYNMEKLVSTVNLADIAGIGKQTVFCYLIGLLVFEWVTWYLYGKRYEYANRCRKKYVDRMSRLNKRYELQERTKTILKEDGRNA